MPKHEMQKRHAVRRKVLDTTRQVLRRQDGLYHRMHYRKAHHESLWTGRPSLLLAKMETNGPMMKRTPRRARSKLGRTRDPVDL
jgi:hypothetical protein